jgi:hypothetical protein
VHACFQEWSCVAWKLPWLQKKICNTKGFCYCFFFALISQTGLSWFCSTLKTTVVLEWGSVHKTFILWRKWKSNNCSAYEQQILTLGTLFTPWILVTNMVVHGIFMPHGNELMIWWLSPANANPLNFLLWDSTNFIFLSSQWYVWISPKS